MIVTSRQCAAVSAALVLIMGAGLQKTVQSASAPAPDNDSQAALLNPKHQFWIQHAPDVCRVRVETSKGTFILEIHRNWSPLGADRFINLVRAGFFDDSRFFRVRPGFIAQFGIAGDPRIAAVWKDEAIGDDSVQQSNARGTIAYAMTGPGTRTTQLYINLNDNGRLDSEGFAPIGKVVEGMEVVDTLYAGYGEGAGGGMRGGKQGEIFRGGNRHLDHEFPLLDKLVRASIVKP